MRDVYVVLRDKTIELRILRAQVDALRLVAPILAEEQDKPPAPQPEGVQP